LKDKEIPLRVEPLLQKLWSDDKSMDMTIMTSNGEKVMCHSVIFSLISNVCADLIWGAEFRDEICLHIPHVSVSAVASLLRRAYCVDTEYDPQEDFVGLKTLMGDLMIPGVEVISRANASTFDRRKRVTRHAWKSLVNKGGPGSVTVVRNESTLNEGSLEGMETGKKKAANEPPENRLCPHCGKNFVDNKKFQYHINWHNGVFPFECHNCDFKSHSLNLLRIHKIKCCPKQNNEPKCELCPEPMSKLHLKNHHSENLPLACNECPYRGASERTIALHASKYHKDKGYKRLKIQCPKCPAMVTKGRIKEHDTLHHDEKLPFGCEQCQYRSVTKAGIVKHMGVYHSTTPRIRCELGCGKTFSQNCSMLYHMRRFCVKSTVKEQTIQKEKDTGKYEEGKINRLRAKERRKALYEELGIEPPSF